MPIRGSQHCGVSWADIGALVDEILRVEEWCWDLPDARDKEGKGVHIAALVEADN